MLSLAGLIAGLFSFLSASLSLFVVADLLTLPLRTAAGQAAFAFLDGLLP